MSQEKVYTFAESHLQIFASNHLDKIAWILILAICSYSLVVFGIPSLYGIFSIIILCMFPFLFGRIQRKFANKIILDFEKHKVTFYMNRGGPIVENNFDALEEILVNGYIIFKVKGQKIFFANSQNLLLLKYLRKISKIQWGYMCNIWGPPQKIRTDIDKESVDSTPKCTT